MAKHSEFERQRRAAEKERVAEIERAWRGSLPADVAAKFDGQVKAAKERGPLPPRRREAVIRRLSGAGAASL